MSWLFSQALVEEYSEDTCLGGAPSALWSGTPTPQASWLRGKTTAACRLSRSGTMFRPLTDDLGEAVLTSFLAAFPVRTSLPQAKAPESTESARACGATWRESFAKWDPASCSWRTAQCSLLEDLERFSETWPRWGIMRHGACSELMMPPFRAFTEAARAASQSHTTETASGLLQAIRHRVPTPTVCGNYNRKGASNKSGNGLATHIKERMPTPVASEGRDCGAKWDLLARLDKGGRIQRRIASRGGPETQQTDRAALNPSWVEWLMGWPIGWTDLHAPATDRFRQWQQSHSESY
jgi:hypothetical protein